MRYLVYKTSSELEYYQRSILPGVISVYVNKLKPKERTFDTRLAMPAVEPLQPLAKSWISPVTTRKRHSVVIIAIVRRSDCTLPKEQATGSEATPRIVSAEAP